jgi:hypothetical protein
MEGASKHVSRRDVVAKRLRSEVSCVEFYMNTYNGQVGESSSRTRYVLCHMLST